MILSSELLVQRIRELVKPILPKPTVVSPRLDELSGIKAVLFDVYGTMFVAEIGDIGISVEQSRADAFGEALAAAGFSGELEEASSRGAELIFEGIERSHARRREEGIEYPEVEIREVFQEILSTLERDGLVQGEVSFESAARVVLEYECRVNCIWPMPGLKETLAELRARDVLLGIVSNAQFYTPLIFRALLGAEPKELGFQKDLIVWSYENLEAKPSEEIFRRVTVPLEQNYGILPDEAVYVGNSMLNDIWPASCVGLRTAHFAGDDGSYHLNQDDPRCSSTTPDVIITDLRQLIGILR